VLSAYLRFTDSDYRFGIFKLYYPKFYFSTLHINISHEHVQTRLIEIIYKTWLATVQYYSFGLRINIRRRQNGIGSESWLYSIALFDRNIIIHMTDFASWRKCIKFKIRIRRCFTKLYVMVSILLALSPHFSKWVGLGPCSFSLLKCMYQERHESERSCTFIDVGKHDI